MAKIDLEPNIKIPTHIAFIVDGNRRWAKEHGLPQFEGHRQGFNNLEKILDECKRIGVKAATAWVFSTENWNRSKEEVDYLFGMFRELSNKYRDKFLREKTRFVHLGRKDHLPEDILKILADMEDETKDFTEFSAALAMDYGGHNEIIRAVKKLNELGLEVTEENIEKCLDTYGMPNVDFIIRTSGEQRLSGFMSWQSHYAEFYFPKKRFPEFSTEDLHEAIRDFSNRERRFGGDSKSSKK